MINSTAPMWRQHQRGGAVLLVIGLVALLAVLSGMGQGPALGASAAAADNATAAPRIPLPMPTGPAPTLPPAPPPTRVPPTDTPEPPPPPPTQPPLPTRPPNKERSTNTPGPGGTPPTITEAPAPSAPPTTYATILPTQPPTSVLPTHAPAPIPPTLPPPVPHPPAPLPPTSTPVPPASVPTSTPVVLIPHAGGPDSGGLAVVEAGPADGQAPDYLEVDDSFERAAVLTDTLVYRRLNFVPSGSGADVDFFTWRLADGGPCYQVVLGDLRPGWHPRIRLWKAAALPEDRRIIARNDATGDPGAWPRDVEACTDGWPLVVEIRNDPRPQWRDARGLTYSLLVLPIGTPTPVPTALPPAPSRSGSQGSQDLPPAGAGGYGPAPAAPRPVAPPTQPALPPPAIPTPPPTGTPMPTPTIGPSATPAPNMVRVAVNAVIISTQYSQAMPQQVLPGLRVEVWDQVNYRQIGSTAITDEHGHAELAWTWTGHPVWISVPQLSWSQSVELRQLLDATTGQPALLVLQAPLEPYDIPAILPQAQR